MLKDGTFGKRLTVPFQKSQYGSLYFDSSNIYEYNESSSERVYKDTFTVTDPNTNKVIPLR